MPYRNDCKNPACLNRINDLEKEITSLMYSKLELEQKLTKASSLAKFTSLFKKTPKALPHPHEGKFWTKNGYTLTVYKGQTYANEYPDLHAGWRNIETGLELDPISSAVDVLVARYTALRFLKAFNRK